jgi:hypothetical protein
VSTRIGSSIFDEALDAETLQEIARVWEEPWGDRRQEIVVIGAEMDEDSLRRDFEACLLTDEEMNLSLSSWLNLPDPFGEWGDEEEEPSEMALSAASSRA